jgi:bacterioferritin (cytochrome b1)
MSNGNQQKLIEHLNHALGWEMRAQLMYAHYAAYVRGINRIHLKPFFEGESTESVGHATIVRDQISKLGGVAVTDRDKTEIVHTTDFKTMLDESMKTETKAAAGYKEVLAIEGIDSETYDAIEQIYFQEERSVEELKQLMGS